MNNPFALFLISFVILSTVAFGQKQQGTAEEKKARDEFETLLKQAGKTNERKISKDEFLAKFKDKKIGEKRFEVLDLNKDGYITEDESESELETNNNDISDTDEEISDKVAAFIKNT